MMLAYVSPSITTLIAEFRALLLGTDQRSLERYWNKHALLRAWYRGGSINFGTRDALVWRTISLKESIDDCILAMCSYSTLVYQDMRKESSVLSTYPVADVDNHQYVDFQQALKNQDGEALYILLDGNLEFFSHYLADHEMNMREKAWMLTMLILSKSGEDAILNFAAASAISPKVFAACMRVTTISNDDLIMCFYKSISSGLHELAVEIICDVPQLGEAISKLGRDSIVEIISTIAQSELRHNVLLVDGVIGSIIKSEYRESAIETLEKTGDLPEGKNNPVLFVLKELQTHLKGNIENQPPLPNTKKRAGSHIQQSIFAPAPKKQALVDASCLAKNTKR